MNNTTTNYQIKNIVYCESNFALTEFKMITEVN